MILGLRRILLNAAVAWWEMFGVGLLTAAIINEWDDHYCYPPAAWYSYGCGAVYHYGYGGYYGAAGRVYGPCGGAGRAAAYNPVTGRAAADGYVSGAAGSAAGVRTNQGTGAAAWDTKYGQGGVAKTKNDNVYAAHNGNVYKKDSDGNWSSNTGSGWKPVEQPTRPASAGSQSATQPQSRSRQSLDSMH
ncbi:MAG: hypothetical protein EHM17_04075 [Verrucomicrobiaceae bacterium]|nr:MAG: hypothetical protein EHM17_04075 [Verrucomicrobiaceae bacterium]